MLPSNTPISRSYLGRLKDNSINFFSVAILGAFFVDPRLSLVGILFIIYFTIAQFKELWFYRGLRRWGFDAFYLQYPIDIQFNMYVYLHLLEYRDMYRKEYVDMGYNLFHDHIGDIIKLDEKWKKLQEDPVEFEPAFYD